MIAAEGAPPRRLMASGSTILGACLAVGLAAWLIPASVQIVSWPRGGTGRVALFAPIFLLRWAWGIAGLAAVAIWYGGRPNALSRQARASAVAPLAALWVWAIPFMPWLPDRFPLLLVLSGPLRWGIALVAAAACVSRGTSARTWRLPNAAVPGRKTACACSLVLYLVLGFRSLGMVGLGGDEPHYLVITQSLLVDHDLKIENNHARGDYRSFFGGDLRPDYMRRGLNGEIYSIHAPGLPALLLPAYALAGARGAIATIGLLAALAALAVFDLAVLVGGSRAAWPTWAGVCLTVPFIPHAWAIFPEMAGAAIVAWSMVWFASDEAASPAQWLGRGMCLAVLPWLHTKFVVLLAALTLLLLIEARKRLWDTAALMAPIVISTGAWLAFFLVVYGTIDPQAPYGDYARQFVELRNIPRSLAGALFDQKFGLLAYAPIYLAAFAGAALMLRDARWRLLGCGSIFVAVLYVFSSARYYMWWGGSSAPARFLVPVVPLLAPMLAAAFTRFRRGLAGAHMWALLIVSLCVSALGIAGFAQGMLFSDPHGVARMAEWLHESAPLGAALPTFTEENWRQPLLRLALWIGAAAVALSVVRLARRRPQVARRQPVFWLMFGEGIVFVIIVSGIVGPFSTEVRAESVRRGRLVLMRRFDPTGLRAFDYRRPWLKKMTPTEWLDASRLSFDVDPLKTPDDQGRLTSSLSLPAGEYQLTVSFLDQYSHGGDLMVSMGNGHVLARANGPLENQAVVRFTMPIEVPRLWIQLSEPASARAVRRVDIAPLSIVPAGERPDVQVRAVETIAGRPNAYMAYVDDSTFPEDGVFWTRGANRGEVFVAPAGASQLRLTLHLGPVGGAVRLDVAGRAEDVIMKADETRTMSIDVPVGAAYFPVGVQAPGAFRPADVDPHSSDRRSLGCHVRIELP